jgi:hypothetical protein
MGLRDIGLLGGLALEVRLPLAEGGEAVHPRPVGKRALGGGHILVLAAPGFLWRCLQGTTIRESEMPGQVAVAVDGIEVRRRFLG